MIILRFMSRVTQTQWEGELRFMKLFFWRVLMEGVPGRVSFLGEARVVMIAVTWVSFFVFQKL